MSRTVLAALAILVLSLTSAYAASCPGEGKLKEGRKALCSWSDCPGGGYVIGGNTKKGKPRKWVCTSRR